MIELDIIRKNVEAEVVDAMRRTWQEIGGDCLQSLQEGEGRSVMKQDEVAECVLDYMYRRPMSPEARTWYDQLGFDEKLAIGKKAFPMKRYGF